MLLSDQIANALKSINQARFEKLIAHLLFTEGYTLIGEPGNMAGKEKTRKGAPDSFFLKNQKYVFAECTTQEKLDNVVSFIEKLESDIEHCFNTKKTGIELEKIGEIILACNSLVLPKEFEKLQQKALSYNPNVTLQVLNLYNLPLRISLHPGLTDEYLDIKTIKADIYTLSAFLKKTENGFQPSLINQFEARENELEACNNALEQYDLLLLTGPAGVGKSRLAVELLEQKVAKEYYPVVIQPSVAPLWDDLLQCLPDSRNYIILFDDVNRSPRNFEYLLSFIQNTRHFKLKVVVTIRDYLKGSVMKIVNQSDFRFKEIAIGQFDDADIEKIILKALPALKKYHSIKEKIIRLARGNARLALMATMSVLPGAPENYLQSAVNLYQRYFEKISTELDLFSRPIILKTIAIVAFFEVLDKHNKELPAILSEKFDINWNELWDTIEELHKAEIVNLHNNDIVKSADQVMASFAFYKCFIDQQSALINYGQWILEFIGTKYSRVEQTLIDANNTFGFITVKELVIPHINFLLLNITDSNDWYSFYELFWFYKGSDTLQFIQKWVTDLAPDQAPLPLTYLPANNTGLNNEAYWELLVKFWNHPTEYLSASLELAIEVGAKTPSCLPGLLSLVAEKFSYSVEDISETLYKRQHILLDVLLNPKLKNIQKKISIGLFLNVSARLLGWHFTDYRPSKRNTVSWVNFDLPFTPELMQLRKRILDHFYICLPFDGILVQPVLQKIAFPGAKLNRELYIAELPLYEKIISEKLSEDQYAHCKFTRDLKEAIEKKNVQTPKEWEKFENSQLIQMDRLLKPDMYEVDEDYDQSKGRRWAAMQHMVKGKAWKDIKRMLLTISNLSAAQENGSDWFLDLAITDLFAIIAEESKELFKKSIELFFDGKLQFVIRPDLFIFVFERKIITPKALLKITEKYDGRHQPAWVITLINTVPQDQIYPELLTTLLQIFKNIDSHLTLFDVSDYWKYQQGFIKYQQQNKEQLHLKGHNIITYLTQLIYQQRKKLHTLIGRQFCSKNAKHFMGHQELLKKVYLWQKTVDRNYDHNGKELIVIITLDDNFIAKCLSKGKLGIGYNCSLRLNRLSLDPLWDLENHQAVIEKILRIILQSKEYSSLVQESFEHVFEVQNQSEERLSRIHNFFDSVIQKYTTDKEILVAIMSVVYEKFRNKFVGYLRKLLFLNSDIEFIRSIHYENGESWSGSRVPVIQKKIDFYQEIIDMLKAMPSILPYLEHIKFFEERITWKKEEIKQELRNDFIEEID